MLACISLSSVVTSVCMAGLRCGLSSFHPVHASAFGWVFSHLSPLVLSLASLGAEGLLFPVLPDPHKVSSRTELIQVCGGQSRGGWVCFLLSHPCRWWQPHPARRVPGPACPRPRGEGQVPLFSGCRGPGLHLWELCWAWAVTPSSLAGQTGFSSWYERQGKAPVPTIRPVPTVIPKAASPSGAAE